MKHKWACVLLSAFFLLFTACSSVGATRVTTERERAVATQAIGVVELAVAAGVAAGKITPEQHAIAATQITQLRELVAQSATTPTTFGDILTQVASLSLAWIPAAEAQP